MITTGVTEKGFDWNDRYNIWSGVIGGFFLALSYFGTDQSQVGRYLTAKDTRESRLGLLLNGLVKVPLQFGILLIGCLVFAFYCFFQAPVFFNKAQEAVVLKSNYAGAYSAAESEYAILQKAKLKTVQELAVAVKEENEPQINQQRAALQQLENESNTLRKKVKDIVKSANPGSDVNDTNYIFLHFVGQVLPKGLVGLIIAIIFLAAWGSIAAALNSLASCTMIDFHKKFSRKQLTEAEEYKWGKLYTLFWGVFCIVIAFFAYNLGNSLIEAVNDWFAPLVGSWFYGTILGIFLVAFYLKHIKGDAVFYAAIVAEVIVISVYKMEIMSFLWLNLIGAVAVILFSLLFQVFMKKEAQQASR